jgi:hypothetical protein
LAAGDDENAAGQAIHGSMPAGACMARFLIIAGILLVVLGLVMGYAPWLVNWFGKLPGDIRIERENGVFFFPITSMLVVSVVLSLVLALFFRR